MDIPQEVAVTPCTGYDNAIHETIAPVSYTHLEPLEMHGGVDRIDLIGNGLRHEINDPDVFLVLTALIEHGVDGVVNVAFKFLIILMGNASEPEFKDVYKRQGPYASLLFFGSFCGCRLIVLIQYLGVDTVEFCSREKS